ncbi:MAG: LamG-like jellyroll fold domain-containing protein [Phycisphaerales bacterium JB063]
MNPPPATIAELLGLCADLLDGTISEPDFARLDALLAEHAEARAFYLEFMRLSTALEQKADDPAVTEDDALAGLEALQADSSPDFFENAEMLLAPPASGVPMVDLTDDLERRRLELLEARRASRPRPSIDRDRTRDIVIPQAVVWVGIAAALALLASVVWMSQPETPPSVTDGGLTPYQPPRADHAEPMEADALAVITAAMGAQLADGRLAGANTSVFDEPIDLDEGVLRLELRSGVELTVEGPARFSLTQAGGVELERGTVVSRVPTQAAAFTVHTQAADVVDRGGEFAVAVASSRQTHVQVYAGEVRVEPRLFSAGPVSLSQGEAGQVGVDRMSEVAFDDAAYLREVPTAYQLLVRELEPLAWWSFARSSDGRVLDWGRAGLHLEGVARHRSVASLQGEAFSIHGVRRPIDLPETTALNLLQGFTIESWIRVDSSAWETSRVFSNQAPSASGGFGFGLVGEQFAQDYRCRDASGNYFDCDPLSVKFTFFGWLDLVTHRPVPTGEWVQIVAVCSADAPAQLYINGRPQRSGVTQDDAVGTRYTGWKQCDPGYASAQTPMIGRNPTGDLQEAFIGDIDELVLYDEPLSAQTILALYEAGVEPASDHAMRGAARRP